MQKVFRVTVDINKKIPAPAFEVNTNDLKSVKLEITITNGQSLLDLTDVTPRINIRKPDNEVIFQDCEIVDATAGKVEITLENQAYLVPGTHTAEIACYKGNDITAITGTFSYKSVKGIMNDEAVESKSEFTAIDRKIEEARKLLEDAAESGVGVDEQARQKIEEVTTKLAEKAQKSDIIPLQTELPKKADKAYVDQVTQSIASGSPKGVYATKAALDAAFPTGNTNIYIVTADGKWYYWNGTAWTSGGTYQSSGIGDSTITPQKLVTTGGDTLGPNLATGDNLIRDKYVHAVTGLEVSYPNTTTGGTTVFIPVTPGEKIRYFAYTSSAGFAGNYYDANKVFKGNLASPQANNTETEMVMPDNAHFIRVNYSYASQDRFIVKRYTSQKYNLGWLEVNSENLSEEIRNVLDSTGSEIEPGSVTLESLSQSVKDFIAKPSTSQNNPFDGKSSAWIGDSITQGTGTTSTDKRYSNIITSQLSMSASNYQNLGVGGSTVARQPASWTVKSFVERICDEKQIKAGKDFIFIHGGVNDFARGTPLSSMQESLDYYKSNNAWNDNTFYGALNRLILYIRENHNNSELVYIVPIHCETENTPNTVGLKMVSYINAIREVCSYYAVPTIDLWNELPIDPKNSGHKAKYTMNGSLTSPDGIHPNNLGNSLMAKKIMNYLKYQYIM